MSGTAASRASCHGPLSTRTSTAATPLCCAHATPATGVGPGFSTAEAPGTSIRDSVLIGACWAHPCPGCAQYATSAHVVTLMSVIHLHADTYPYSPGTTIRTGNPC